MDSNNEIVQSTTTSLDICKINCTIDVFAILKALALLSALKFQIY